MRLGLPSPCAVRPAPFKKTRLHIQFVIEPNFVSLLYYSGLVTIGGTYMGETKFVIPNEVVREQIFSYLLGTYGDNDLSDTVNVNDNIGQTKQHQVIVIYRGVEMVACEEPQCL